MELDPFTMLPAPPRNPPGLKRMFEYPDRAEQLGAPPLVGELWSDEPFLMREAVGERSYLDIDPLALDFRSHVSGQANLFLEMSVDWTVPAVPTYTESDAYQRVCIREGEICNADLVTISIVGFQEVVLGWKRGTDGHGRNPLTFVDGPDLSDLDVAQSLEVHAIEFTDEHMGTLGSAWRLRYLTLDGAQIQPASLAGCTKLQVLRLADLDSFGTDLSFVGSLPELALFEMRFSPLEAHHLAPVALHPSLRVLDLGYNPGIGAELSILAGATGLTYLNLSGTRVEGTTLRTVSGLGGLEHLMLQCTNVTDDGLDALSALSRVTTLNVAGNRITDDGLARIVDAMPQLRKLDIRSTEVTPDGAMVTGRLKNLRTLALSGNVLTIRLAEHLKAGTHLAQVEVCPPHPDFDEETEAIDIIGGARHIGGPR